MTHLTGKAVYVLTIKSSLEVPELQGGMEYLFKTKREAKRFATLYLNQLSFRTGTSFELDGGEISGLPFSYSSVAILDTEDSELVRLESDDFSLSISLDLSTDEIHKNPTYFCNLLDAVESAKVLKDDDIVYLDDMKDIKLVPRTFLSQLYRQIREDEERVVSTVTMYSSLLGLFIEESKYQVYIACDNRDGVFFTEDFGTYEAAVLWLLEIELPDGVTLFDFDKQKMLDKLYQAKMMISSQGVVCFAEDFIHFPGITYRKGMSVASAYELVDNFKVNHNEEAIVS